MSFLPIKVPNTALHELVSLFAPPDTLAGSTLELVITIEDTNINAREFAAYLSLMDRVYGRVSRGGIRSYSLTRYMQLEITEIRKGSTEVLIVEFLSHFRDTFPFVILWLFLKYLPIGFKAISEGTKNFADAFKSFEEGRLIRERRKQLKDEMKSDEHLRQLSNTQINRLMALLASLETDEGRTLPAATRFAQKYVKSVTITVKKREETTTPRRRLSRVRDQGSE
jgi:hypothetical protein